MPVGGATNVRFQNASMPAPPRKGRLPAHDVDHVDLAECDGIRLAEFLDEVDARQVVGVGALDAGEIERGIDGNQHAAATVDAVPEVVFAVHGHREAVPEAQLAQVGSDEQVGLAAVLVAEIAFSGSEALVELGQARLHLDPMFIEPCSTSAPVTRERVACQPVRSPVLNGSRRAARRDARHDECHRHAHAGCRSRPAPHRRPSGTRRFVPTANGIGALRKAPSAGDRSTAPPRSSSAAAAPPAAALSPRGT